MERGGHHRLLGLAAGAHLRPQPSNRTARFLVRLARPPALPSERACRRTWLALPHPEKGAAGPRFAQCFFFFIRDSRFLALRFCGWLLRSALDPCRGHLGFSRALRAVFQVRPRGRRYHGVHPGHPVPACMYYGE